MPGLRLHQPGRRSVLRLLLTPPGQRLTDIPPGMRAARAAQMRAARAAHAVGARHPLTRLLLAAAAMAAAAAWEAGHRVTDLHLIRRRHHHRQQQQLTRKDTT